jgi:hypothetical protein
MCLLPALFHEGFTPPLMMEQAPPLQNISFCRPNSSQPKTIQPPGPGQPAAMSLEYLFIPLGCFLNGLGTRLAVVYGLSYLDRNTCKEIFPVYLDICLASKYTYDPGPPLSRHPKMICPLIQQYADI